MSERRVGLNLTLGHGGPGTGTSIAQREFAQGEPPTADPAAAARFAEALGAGSAQSPQPARQTAPGLPMPYARLARPMHAFDEAATVEMLERLVDTLYVCEHGGDARHVRIDLDDAVFPGVTLSVYRDAGAWVAAFACRAVGPFIALAGAAPTMARRLAHTLGQDVLWRVIAEGLPSDDPTWLPWCDRTDPDARGPQGATEAFASAPGVHAR